MSDTVKLIIEIPKEIYIHFLSRYKYQDTNDIGLSECEKVGVAIKNGTPLPKGHGRLIDADVLVDGMEDDFEFCEVVNATPTIIESDKESETN